MKYIVELVTREAPYIGLAYVKNTSLEDNVLNFGKKEEALVIEDKETMDKVLSLISKHNSNRDLVSVMDWITEVGSNKRVFSKNIVW